MTPFVIIVVVLAKLVVRINIRLIKERNQVRSTAWSDVDVQLTRRHDLAPQLLKAVKAYADYEKATLTASPRRISGF